jgi:hypothetical protein
MGFPRLFRRRMILWPTFAGWLLFAILFSSPICIWALRGEKMLSRTDRKPAEILVVEGWICDDGLVAAAHEFVTGGYKLVVVTGEYTSGRWNTQRWCFADVASAALLRSGIPADSIVRAPAEYSERMRTFESALAVRSRLHELRGLHQPSSVNVYTAGLHARRSQLVYAKVLGEDYKVGVISWMPTNFLASPWWKSSDRAKDMIIETVGWFFELLLNSGRQQNY